MTSIPERRRRWPLAVVIVLVLVGAIVAAFLIVDGILRSAAERVVADQFSSRLAEDGTAAADVRVRIGGASVIVQYLGGRFEDVAVTATGIPVQGTVVDLDLHATGVPTDADTPVERISGDVALTADAVNTLISRNGGTAQVALGDGSVTYTAGTDFLGVPLTFAITATADAAGDSLTFTPTGATLQAGSAGIDVSGLVDAVLDRNGITICVADQLPAGVQLAGADVTPRRVLVSFTAADVAISDLATRGTCPA